MNSATKPVIVVLLLLILEANAIATLPDFGTAATFAVLGQASVSNTGPSSVIGSIGTASAAPTAITGFPKGSVFLGQTAANTDAATAYGQLLAQVTEATLDTELGNQLITPGVYELSTAEITGTLTLDAQGTGSAVWVFKIASTLVTDTSSIVSLVNGASACGVFWAVGSSATIGTYSTFHGTIVSQASVVVKTGASVNGSLYGTGNAVTLDSNAVTYCGDPTDAIIGFTSTAGGTIGGQITTLCTLLALSILAILVC